MQNLQLDIDYTLSLLKRGEINDRISIKMTFPECFDSIILFIMSFVSGMVSPVCPVRVSYPYTSKGGVF